MGRCFRLGECVPEQCSGRDEDCDGITEESFPEQGEACVTSLPEVCRDGRKTCDGGRVACAPVTPARTEACDGLDDDCDGSTDEDLDLSSDPLHCGGCGRPRPPGTRCAAGECREVSCAGGLDGGAARPSSPHRRRLGPEEKPARGPTERPTPQLLEPGRTPRFAMFPKMQADG